MMLTTMGLPAHFGMATIAPLPRVMDGFPIGFTAFTLLFRYGAAAKPKQRYQRNGSEGESGGSEEQRCCGVHALHLRHECESPNEGRQYEACHAANLFLCMSTHRKACFDQRIKPYHILVRLYPLR